MRPKGPLPPRVYWRRRLIVIGIAVAVIIVIVLIIAAIARGGAPKPGSSSNPGGSSADVFPTGEPTISPTAGGTCDPAKVTLTADTDKSEYAAGELPQLWLTLENKSAQPCAIGVGGDQVTFTITSPSGSGDEVYWTTKDCSDPSPAATVTLKNGVPVESSTKTTWPRTRSTPGDCIATAPQVGSDGASFDFTITLGTLTATKRIYLY